MNLKVGDKVRLKSNHSGAHKDDPDVSSALYQPGEYVTVAGMPTENHISLPNGQWVSLSDLDLEELAAVCTCSIMTLMQTGCRCGHLERERKSTGE